MLKKTFFLWSLLYLCLALMTAGAEAARLHELNSLSVQELNEDGRDILRIEIGMNRGALAYTTLPIL